MENLYNALKQDFGLKDKHLLILKGLETSPKRAEELCKSTKIPQGRIYEYLNKLVESGLIHRSHKKPYTYEIKDLRKSVLWYTKQKIDSMVKAQEEIISHLQESKTGDVTLIHSADLFTKTHCNIISKSNVFRTMGIHNSFPFMIYPEDLSEFTMLRNVITKSRPTIAKGTAETTLLVYKTYMDAFKKNSHMGVVFEKKTLENHLALFEKYFDKEELLRLLQSMIEKLENHSIKAYVIDEYNAMQIDFNEKEVCLCVNYSGVTSGFHIRSKELASFFNRVFLEKIKRGEDVLPLLKEKIRTIKGEIN